MPVSSPLRAAAALAAALLLAACQAEAVTEAPPDPVVLVETVRPVSLADTVTLTGVVRPREEVPESFRVAGKLVERLVEPGDPVGAGAVIARLDATDLALAAEQAEAAVAAARSARDRADEAEGRARALAGKGHLAEAGLDAVRLAADEARARLRTAERALALARNQLAYAELRASADGVVSAVLAEAGQVVAAGAPVVTVARMDAPEVLVAVPESGLSMLEGSTAEIALWAGGRAYAGRLAEVSPEADPATRTYAARFTVADADAAVRLGMTATVRLTKGDPRSVYRVGPAAVVDEGRGPAVFTVDPATNRLARRPIEVARYESDAVVVTAGLEPGDRVVVLGADRLEDGRPVRVVE